MWVLVVVALGLPIVFTVPGFSTEQTRSAGAKETMAAVAQSKPHVRWAYHCIKTS
jgi:hypothetical protein